MLSCPSYTWLHHWVQVVCHFSRNSRRSEQKNKSPNCGDDITLLACHKYEKAKCVRYARGALVCVVFVLCEVYVVVVLTQTNDYFKLVNFLLFLTSDQRNKARFTIFNVRQLRSKHIQKHIAVWLDELWVIRFCRQSLPIPNHASNVEHFHLIIWKCAFDCQIGKYGWQA